MTNSRSIRLVAVAVLAWCSPAFSEGGNPKEGKAVFVANCAVCHGREGKGDGPGAAGLNPKPANYSQRESTEARQLRIVSNGGKAEGLSPGMPSWGDTLSQKEVRDVVAYVRTELSGGKYADGAATAAAPAPAKDGVTASVEAAGK